MPDGLLPKYCIYFQILNKENQDETSRYFILIEIKCPH